MTLNAHHKKITRALKQTRKGESHLLTKKISASFHAYAASQGWTMSSTQVGDLVEVKRLK